MQTRTRHEEEILKEIREIPEKAIPQVINILRSLRQSIFAGTMPKKAKSSGLCGIWKDDRNAEDIIKDIRSHRTGFGGRRINL
jgi:hypothetical protein